MTDATVQNKSFWQLSRKIPIVIAGSSAISAFLIMAFALIQIGKIEEKNIQLNFANLTNQRIAALERYFSDIESDLRIITDSPMAQNALNSFSRAWTMTGTDAEKILQKSYIDDNPHPIGQKQRLVHIDGDFSAYGNVHKSFHPWFKQFLEERGYYDIFLIDMQGNLLYSVYKERDFATNLKTGEWKNTGLAKSYDKALTLGKDEQAFVDFMPYAPSHNAPASFIAQPIFNNGLKKGVLIFQMPADRINQVIGNRIGLGETGESILVGTDKLARNQSPLTDEPTMLKRKVDGIYVNKALKGESGFVRTKINGDDEFIGYTQFSFLGTDFALIVTEGYDELFAPITEIRNQLVLGLCVIVAVVMFVGVGVGRGISKPISRLTECVSELASGTSKSVEMQNRNDELGEMARSLNQIHTMSVENKRIRAALDNATTCIMVADSDRNVVYMNPSVIKMMQNAEEDIQKAIPNFTVNGLMGHSIDDYHKNPEVQAEILANLNGIHKTRMTMGNRTFDLTAASVIDTDGERLGNVVEWADITDELARETEEKRIAEETIVFVRHWITQQLVLWSLIQSATSFTPTLL